MKFCNGTFTVIEPTVLEHFNQFPFELSNFQKWAIYSIYKKAYSTAVMSFILTIMNIYGYILWLS